MLSVKSWRNAIIKGDELGLFQFGGSDVVTVFDKKSEFPVDPSFCNRESPPLTKKANPLPYCFYGTSLVARQ